MRVTASDLKLYWIAGTQDLAAGQSLPDMLEEGIRAGITAFQFREKGAGSLESNEAIIELGKTLREICRLHAIPFIVNDDVDLAIQLEADGIHLGQSDYAVEKALHEHADRFSIGLSCHSLAEVEKANQLRQLAYLGIGPVFQTISKADAEAELGLIGLQQLVAASDYPVVAIGGIYPENAWAILAQGVAGLSFISALVRSTDKKQTLHQLAGTTDDSGKIS